MRCKMLESGIVSDSCIRAPDFVILPVPLGSAWQTAKVYTTLAKDLRRLLNETDMKCKIKCLSHQLLGDNKGFLPFLVMQ